MNRRRLLAMAVLVLMSGCGRRGDLRLPDRREEVPSPEIENNEADGKPSVME
ncbi:MAG: lipoprotein [Geminicoccaceae bacterium]|nr:lipoprotein [Geminicoccaceae bacterium]MCB2009958.1 lipoprotein [Geminicoccaceae bacterium]